MILTITGYGNSVSKRGNCLVLKNDTEEKVISVDAVSAIIISTACSLTTDAVMLCIENHIEFTFLNSQGQPYAEIQPFSGGCAPIIKRRQLQLQGQEKGVVLVKRLLKEKTEQRIRHLRQLAKSREKHRSRIAETIDNMEKQQEKINVLQGVHIGQMRASLHGYEGSAGRFYFEQISQLLPLEYQFSKRSFQPASDMYNCLLNYGYGILYSFIKQKCYMARLDPYIGIMHVDSYNKPTFVYDLVEAYRYLSEKTAFKICSRKMVKRDVHFRSDEEGILLNTEGKKILLCEIYGLLRQFVVYNNKRITLEQKIQEEIKDIAKYISEV